MTFLAYSPTPITMILIVDILSRQLILNELLYAAAASAAILLTHPNEFFLSCRSPAPAIVTRLHKTLLNALNTFVGRPAADW